MSPACLKGKGDIAWKGGGLLGLRTGKLTVAKEQEKNIQHIAEEWCHWYQFSKAQKTPFTVQFVTSSGINYELMITEIRSEGVKIVYKKK